MARPVLHKGDLLPVAPAVRTGPQFIQMGTQQFHQLQIGFLVIAADVVRFPRFSAGNDRQQRLAVIPHIQPVPHVFPLAVYRNGFPAQRFQDNDGYQLFRELVRAVIVGTVGDQHGQPVRIVPGAHQVVAGGLAGGIRGMGAIRRGLREQAFLSQGAVHFIRGNVVEAETLLFLSLQGTVIFQGGLKHGKSAHDVGGHKISRIVNGTVHMGFRRQVHHPVRSVLPQSAPHQGSVPDVGVQKAVCRRIRRAVQ